MTEPARIINIAAEYAWDLAYTRGFHRTLYVRRGRAIISAGLDRRLSVMGRPLAVVLLFTINNG